MKCLKCGHGTLHRTKRRGFVQKYLLPRFGFYPWKCNDCYAIRICRVRQDSREALNRDQTSKDSPA